MMRIGISTRLLWEAEKNIQVSLEFISNIADAAELWVMPPFFPSWRTSTMKGDLDKIRDALTVFELETTIHAPHHDVNLSSLNPAVSSMAYGEVSKAMEVADVLGSSVVTFHPGGVKYGGDRGLQVLYSNLSRLEKMAGEYNVALCLENMLGEYMFCRTSREVIEAVGALEHINVTLDLAHALVQAEGIGDYVKRLGSKIRHVHISDFKSKQHLHIPLGEGELEFNVALDVLRKIGFDGIFVIEGVPQKPHHTLPGEANLLKKLLSDVGFT